MIREKCVPKISGRMLTSSLITSLSSSTPTVYHDVDEWVKGDSPSAYSGRFLGHRSVQNSAKNTHRMPMHSSSYLEIN
jgi:hypothetical protein